MTRPVFRAATCGVLLSAALGASAQTPTDLQQAQERHERQLAVCNSGKLAAPEREACVRDACHKRARPIIMTTLAMGAGMLPIAVGLGSADSSFRSPMAMAVIGGLITSTVLSLLVVPAVFTYVDDVEGWIRRTVRRLRGQPAAPEAKPDAAHSAG